MQMSDRVSSFKCAGTFVLRDLEENKNARLLNERKRRQGHYIVSNTSYYNIRREKKCFNWIDYVC